jgi:ComF family protein
MKQNIESSSISQHLSNIGMSLLNICTSFNQHILPQSCLLCGTSSGEDLVCDACFTRLPYHTADHCPICALPSPNGNMCGKCLRQKPFFDKTIAALRYEFPVDTLIHSLKYGSRLAIAPLLGQLLTIRTHSFPRPDMLLPMPLHFERLRERGFNQSTEIAGTLSRHLGIPVSHACHRIRATSSQAGLSLEKRGANLKGAFECDDTVRGLHVAVLDDVMTSGATLNEIARMLKDKGAKEVSAWVVARTLMD